MTISKNTALGWRLTYFKMIVPWKPFRLREVFLLLLNMKGQHVISALAAANFAPAKATIENSSCQKYVKVRNSLCDLFTHQLLL